MLDDFFIKYANFSFKENPENLYMLSNEIDEFLFPIDDWGGQNSLKFFVKELISLSELNDPGDAWQLKPKLTDCSEDLPTGHSCKVGIYDPYFDVAYYAAYWYQDQNCRGECKNHYGPGLAKIGESSDYGGNRRLKCFECWQIYFGNLLTKLVEGESLIDLIHPTLSIEDQYKEVAEIFPDGNFKVTREKVDNWPCAFELYIKNALHCVAEKILPINDNELIRKRYISSNNLLGDERSRYPIRNRFNEYIASLVGYSLTNFLFNDKRAKLKKCHECDNFFKASKNDSRIKYCSECSPKSKKNRAKSAKYMRQYRLKRRQEKMAEKREAKIINYINNLDCTREEAIKIIELEM